MLVTARTLPDVRWLAAIGPTHARCARHAPGHRAAQFYESEPRNLRSVQCSSFEKGSAAAAGSPDLTADTGRRCALLAVALAAAGPRYSNASAASGVPAATIRPELTPDQSKYNAQDPELREAAALLQRGLNATDVQQEEAVWTEIIERYGQLDAPWVPDVVGRAWGNRGNARSRQGKLQQALEDYNTSISICPWSVDPVLNRGVVLEALSRFDEAIADYRAVLAAAPNDPAAWNNLGNATAGLGRWDEAVEFYGRAARLAPEFSFAAANQALALYQLGRVDEAMRTMRSLLRRYPEFPDMRAALAAALWATGKEGEAETQWQRLEDPRYRDLTWVESRRRWPPALVSAWRAFLAVKSVAAAN